SHGALGHGHVQWRSRFDSQLVTGDVRGLSVQHALHGAPPARVAESGHAVDEVAVDVGEPRRAYLVDSGQGAIRVVHPAQEAERIRLEALHADADPVEAGAPPDGCPLAAGAGWIRLQRHLRAVADRERRLYLAEH